VPNIATNTPAKVAIVSFEPEDVGWAELVGVVAVESPVDVGLSEDSIGMVDEEVPEQFYVSPRLCKWREYGHHTPYSRHTANSPATMQGTKSSMARDSRLDEMTLDDTKLVLYVSITIIVEDVLEALDTLGVVVTLVVAVMKILGVQYTEIILDALSESEASLLGQRTV
jgi:hypothetical protein